MEAEVTSLLVRKGQGCLVSPSDPTVVPLLSPCFRFFTLQQTYHSMILTAQLTRGAFGYLEALCPTCCLPWLLPIDTDCSDLI